MKNLNQLLKRPLHPFPVSTAVVVMIIAILGFADATFLSIEHYRGVIPPCSLVSGCDTVLTSSYSTILGIPVSLLGSLFYLSVLVGVFSYIESRRTSLIKWSLLMTIPGFIFSLWFLFIQIFVLNSYCLYCLVSAGTATLLFVISMHVFGRNEHEYMEEKS